MRLNEFTQQSVKEDSGYDGSAPLDLNKDPSVNDVFKRALYIYDYEGYGNNMDYSEDDAIDQYVERKFGEDILDQLNKARYQSYFGREGGNNSGHIRSSNLGAAGASAGNFRTTKAGKMHSQDVKMMKNKIADRLGRHPEPALPEGVVEGEGNLATALGKLSGSWSGWHKEEDMSSPDIDVYEYDDGEGGYYGHGTIEHNLKSGEVKVEYHDSENDMDVDGTFKNMGDAMRALRGDLGVNHGGRAPNFDRLGQRKQHGPDDLRKTDRTGRKGTLAGGPTNTLKRDIEWNKGKHGPSGKLPEADNNYHANRTGFSQGQRDDERHDLDVPRPLIYGLKINGKIWKKDGNTVTFFTKERALAARNSILAKRPDVEVGLVQRPQD